MFAKKCPKNDKTYIFEKPLTMPFQIGQKISKRCKWIKTKILYVIGKSSHSGSGLRQLV